MRTIKTFELGDMDEAFKFICELTGLRIEVTNDKIIIIDEGDLVVFKEEL